MKTLSVTEVARNFSAVVDSLERDQEEIVLVRNRRQEARLVPEVPRQDALEAELADIVLPAAAWPELDELAGLPVTEHVARYDALHGELSEALAAIDRQQRYAATTALDGRRPAGFHLVLAAAAVAGRELDRRERSPLVVYPAAGSDVFRRHCADGGNCRFFPPPRQPGLERARCGRCRHH